MVVADIPARTSNVIEESKVRDKNVRIIIESFKSTQKIEDYANWTERSFVLNQKVLIDFLGNSHSYMALRIAEKAFII
ncbi:hypothetical protein CEXT_495771 [Caerostris extrusa]|uniref:Uncharacterized protein n=1 Tax=Caerostris extrusa TaxID=172846 RepID=A0AAV4RV50_CAEEX|nr:hypothetical protein CEXT_495771 [Caerostris extrusa]